jgi:arylsulfatase A-like enzyme
MRNVGAAVLAFLLVAPALVAAFPTAASATGDPTKPNFVVIYTDDQRWDAIGKCRNGFDAANFSAGADACMPFLQQELIPQGTTFLRGYDTTSLCCPARAGMLTGQYARHTGVIDNSTMTKLDDTATIATWLQSAGYRTALMGKYLNGYGDIEGAVPPNYVPPGWDSWHAFWNTSEDMNDYTSYSMVEKDPGGTASTIPYSGTNLAPTACAAGTTYSTDLLCRRSLDFMAGNTTNPFFLYFAPFSPHLPATAPSRYANTYAGLPLPQYPNINQVPTPNPPSYLPNQPLTDKNLNANAGGFRSMLAANRAVDDAINQFYQQLSADGRLSNTVWVFMSDNGLARSEHRWGDKLCEYEECHKVPLVVVCPPSVCPGAIPGQVDSQHSALNIDIAPTLTALAGVMPTIPEDGRSLVPLLSANPPNWRSAFLLEDFGLTKVDGPTAIVSNEPDGHIYKYVKFALKPTQFELFDLTNDPWELSNLASNPAYATIKATLAAKLRDMSTAPVVSLSGPSGPVAASTVTFTWTSDGVATFSCRLDNAAFSPCGSGTSGSATLVGLNLTDHQFTVKGVDPDNNQSTPVTKSFTVTADTTPPPAPTLVSTPPDPSDQTVAFVFTDDENGVTFTCSLDGATPAPCSSPQAYQGLSDGSHTFRVRAVDAAGNVSDPTAYPWTVVDQTAPDAPVFVGTPLDPGAPNATFTFTTTPDATATCSLDGVAFSACTSPLDLTGLAEGPHSFAVRAVDADGNRSATSTFSWTVDDTPHAPVLTSKPPSPSSADVTFAWTSDAVGATFECSLDGAGSSACTSPVAYQGLTDGTHSFAVRTVDGTGATSGWAGMGWIVDATPPSPPNLVGTPPQLSASADATFVFDGEAGTTFTCSLDGSSFDPCTSPALEQGLADGSHTFRVRAVDQVGNRSDATSFTWTIDTSAPPVPTITQPPANPSTSTASLSFTDAESGTTFRCSLDGSAPTACLSPQSYLGLSAGSHTVSVQAVDGAGNVSAAATASWTADVAPPTVSIAAPATDALTTTTSIPVQWTGSDNTAIAAYDVLERVGTSGSQTVVLSTTATSTTIVGQRGTTYCFQIRARDTAGNQTTSAERCAGVPYDDGDPAVQPAGAVAHITAASAFNGTLTVLDSSGEQLTASFTGRKVGLLVRRDPASGMADISLDGNLVTRVDCYSKSVSNLAYVWQRSLTPGPHTVTVSWTGAKNNSATGTSLSIDGFGVVGG